MYVESIVLNQMASGLKFDAGRQTRNYLQRQLDSMEEKRRRKQKDQTEQQRVNERQRKQHCVLKTG